MNTVKDLVSPPTVRLDVRQLAKSYGIGKDAVEIIRDLTFQVHDREIVSVVGPSGVGKTTLLRCLAGLQPLSSGEARIDGEVIDGPPEHLSLVFQDYGRSLMPWLTVEKNVWLPLRHLRLPKAERQARISEALDAVGLGSAGHKYPWQMSGGMQQRAAIARAIAYRPEVLIMDEPFASVDAQTRFDLEDLCLKIRDKFGMTIVVVTHDIDEAVYLSDRIVVVGRRPAVVTEIVSVPFTGTRDQISTRSAPEFASLRTDVMSMIRDAH